MNQRNVSQETGGDRIHVQGPIFISSWQLDVCNGLHRPYIAHAVGVVSRYMNNLGKEHWEAVKWILRYLRGTANHALCFGCSESVLQEYVDSDMAGDKDSRRSTTGYVFTIGGTTVSWISKLQKVVALSITEAEYVAATEASKEMIWL